MAGALSCPTASPPCHRDWQRGRVCAQLLVWASSAFALHKNLTKWLPPSVQEGTLRGEGHGPSTWSTSPAPVKATAAQPEGPDSPESQRLAPAWHRWVAYGHRGPRCPWTCTRPLGAQHPAHRPLSLAQLCPHCLSCLCQPRRPARLFSACTHLRTAMCPPTVLLRSRPHVPVRAQPCSQMLQVGRPAVTSSCSCFLFLSVDPTPGHEV